VKPPAWQDTKVVDRMCRVDRKQHVAEPTDRGWRHSTLVAVLEQTPQPLVTDATDRHVVTWNDVTIVAAVDPHPAPHHRTRRGFM
jgi:hypothetical protein